VERLKSCRGVVPGTFTVCGEDPTYAFCSKECEFAHKLGQAVDAMTLTTDVDYSHITDRLAVGNVASRQVPGFVAVVSLLATAPVNELYGAPKVPGGLEVKRGRFDLAVGSQTTLDVNHPLVLHIDINDGEGPGSPLGDGRDLADYLADATAFIAAYIKRGCVLVHCGAGKSRSVAVVVAYLCRYAGMSYVEALTFVKSQRPGAAPADCFADAVKRWLRLDDLATTGPRR
jgi:hypothetical protein